MSDDQRNGGAKGVGEGAEEAAKAIGWEFRLLDGQGQPSTRASALTQAIALQPAGIILGTIDAREQAPIIEQAVAAGIKVVGWHSGGAPGPIEGVPGCSKLVLDDGKILFTHEAAVASMKPPFRLNYKATEASWKRKDQ